MNTHSRNRYYAEEFEAERPKMPWVVLALLAAIVTHALAIDFGRDLQRAEEPRYVYVPMRAEISCSKEDRERMAAACVTKHEGQFRRPRRQG